MIFITDQNAFYLRVTAQTKAGSQMADVDLSVIKWLVAQFVRRGRSLQSMEIDSQGRAVIFNSGDLAMGVYGVEFNGYYNGQPWRFFEKKVFAIVDQTVNAVEQSGEINGIPVFDVTLTITLGGEGVPESYVTNAINEHDNDMNAHPYLQELIENAGKVDDVKVNGLSVVNENKEANINITATIDGNVGEPEVDVEQEDGEIRFAFRNMKGEKGETGQQGPRGKQGDSAVYNPDDPDAPDFVMANTTGDSTTKAMTQKAVTDELEIKMEVEKPTFTDGKGVLVSNGSLQTMQALAYSDYIDISDYDVLYVPVLYITTTYGFALYNSSKTFISGGRIDEVKTEGGYKYIRILTNGAQYICITAHASTSSYSTGSWPMLYKAITVHDKLDPSSQDFIFSSAKGNSEKLGMTQEAITEGFKDERIHTDNGDIISETTILDSNNTWYVGRVINPANGNADQVGGTLWKACADIDVRGYDCVKYSSLNSNVAGIAFYDANNQFISGKNGDGLGKNIYNEDIIPVPKNAVRIGISALNDTTTYGEPYVYGLKTTGGIIKANETRYILDAISLGDEKEIHAGIWMAGYMNSTGAFFNDENYCLSTFIKAEGLTSIKTLIDENISINCFDEYFNHVKLFQNYGKEISILPIKCAYIIIWFAHDDITTADECVEIKRKCGGIGRLANLDGKSIVTFGDSITWYDSNVYLNGKAQGQKVKGFQTYMREVGMNVANKGASGYSMPQILPIVQAFDRFDKMDYMTIMSGANDTRLYVEPGTPSPIGSTYDTTTYSGAMQTAIEYALAQNPKLKIVLFTPIKGWFYGNDPRTVKSAFVSAVKAIGKIYSIPVLDLHNMTGLNDFTRDIMINDPEPPENELYSLHPSNYGYERMASVILPFLADA